MEIIFENEVPYNSLKEIGISKKDFLSLPVDILDKLLTGRLSPLLACNVNDKNNFNHDFLAKILFTKSKEGVELVVFPKRLEFESDIPLLQSELEILKSGGVIKKRINKDNKRVFNYIQMDLETNNLISINTNLIYIPSLVDDCEISEELIEIIKEGKPVEINSNNKLLTVGVDLEAKSGISYVYGGIEDWRLHKLQEWDRLNPNVVGYWQTSQNGWEYLHISNENKRTFGFSM